MYLVINKCVTTIKVSNFSGHYLRNRSTLDIGVLGYIGIVKHKEHSPEVLSIPPGTSCMSVANASKSAFMIIWQCSDAKKLPRNSLQHHWDLINRQVSIQHLNFTNGVRTRRLRAANKSVCRGTIPGHFTDTHVQSEDYCPLLSSDFQLATFWLLSIYFSVCFLLYYDIPFSPLNRLPWFDCQYDAGSSTK